VRNPRVIVEVLSPDTAAFDRGDKFDGYRSLASLSDYLLVAQDKAQVEHYRREADGSWRLRVLRDGARIDLESLGVELSVDEAYEGALVRSGA
jgi:Uma2 family endonuclease